MLVTFTEQQLIEYYWHPFPPEEGYKYDLAALGHHFLETAAFGGADSSKLSDTSRSLALAGVAAAIVDRARAEYAAAASVDEGVAQFLVEAGASRVQACVDGLLATHPVCDVNPLPRRPEPIVFGTTVVVVIPSTVTPPPVPPEWAPGEEISPMDLLAVATRFKTAAETAELGPMKAELEAGAERLVEAAQKRLG